MSFLKAHYFQRFWLSTVNLHPYNSCLELYAGVNITINNLGGALTVPLFSASVQLLCNSEPHEPSIVIKAVTPDPVSIAGVEVGTVAINAFAYEEVGENGVVSYGWKVGALQISASGLVLPDYAISSGCPR